MRFKKLELLGFKSFGEHTELIFEPGVTAVVGPNGCGKCLSFSQEILTSDGKRFPIGPLVESVLKQVSSVVSLDDGVYTTENPARLQILSLNPQTLKLEPRPVAAFIKRTAPEYLLKVQTKSGKEITATPYHPLFTLKNGRLQALRADEVEIGTRIAVPRTLPLDLEEGQLSPTQILEVFVPEDNVFVPYSLELRQFIRQLACRHQGVAGLEKVAGVPKGSLRGIWSRQGVNAAFMAQLLKLDNSWNADASFVNLKSKGTGQVRIPRVLDRAAARTLGYLVAEGRNTSASQAWFVNSDMAVVADFIQCAEKAFGVKAQAFSYKPDTKDVLIFSRSLCKTLDRLYGFPIDGKSAVKRIPEQIMTAPKAVAAEFISALFEGDAYLSARGSMRYIEYATASERLARDLVSLLLRFGVTTLLRPKVKYASNTQTRTRRPYYSVYIYGAENLRIMAGILKFVGVKKEALSRFQEIECAPNPNLDLVPGAASLIRNLTKTSGLRVKPLRAEFPRLAAYAEERCEASRGGIAEAVAVVQQQGTRTTETEAICANLRTLSESDLYWDEIVAVDQVPPESPWVYDLSIAETHNFVAQDIVVHNSNVADAIKWVLGEQSPRELRGGRMEDLIFNGSDRREPVHFAEVSLTLDNSEKKLPIDFSEVVISRRLFRTGESEYLLNRSACRLKDIQELLMGTGIGTSAYSLFEQGRIEQIISARPEDRRVVFEEAAGITKFKSQKREALRKLEETEDNLARVNDVISEVRRQIQALERQVRRAKAYQEQMEELKKLEIGLARRDQERLAALAKEKEESLQSFRTELAGLEEQAAGQEAALSEARGRVSEADEAFSQAREGVLAATHRQDTAKNNLQVNRERIAEAQAQAGSDRQEIEEAQQQTVQLQEQIRQLNFLIGQEQEERRLKEERITQWQAQLAGCARMIDEAQGAITRAREQLLDLTGSEVQLKNQVARVRQESARLDARAARLQAETGKVSREQEEAASKLVALEQEVWQARAAMHQLEQEQAAAQKLLNETETALAAAEQDSDNLSQEFTRVGSQLEALKGLLDSHEGYSGGVKALLTALDEGLVPRDGVAGVLAELIQVDRNDMAAVDAALGFWAEAVVVETASVAERCRQFLESSRAGRVLFLILDRVQPAAQAAAAPGALALIERIGITPHLQPLLAQLLADTWQVADRDAALAQSGLGRFVTSGGELYTSTHMLLGPAPAEEGILVGRTSRLQSLEVSYASLSGRLEEAQAKAALLREQRQERAQALAALDGTARQRIEELHRAEAQFASAQADSEKLKQEMDVLRTEESETAAELKEVHAEQDRWEKELAAKEQELETHQAAIRQAQDTIAETGRMREEISVELAGAKSALAALDEVSASRKSSLEVLEQSAQSLLQRIASRREELAQLEQRQLQLEEACVRVEQELAGMEAEIAQAQAKADEAGRRREEAQQAAQAQEQEFVRVRRRLDQLQSQLHAQEMEQAQLAFQKEQIAARLLQLYQVSLEELPPEQPLQEGEEPLDFEAAKIRVEELSVKLQKMGPVNLGSIEEERELQNRFEFLNTQHADLTKAKDDLHAALTKINRTTRAMFRETFEAIHAEFQVTFKQLFGGGEARLVLLDEEDLLESGIEIIARPPGKPLQAISLLSGGEKALTTIALLFAIFKIKPSPFCLLDEIDAPLDEANVDRFTRALKEFLKDSQFIIITHNKKTMSMADVLYGVTMQEMGVSRIVSVKLKKDGQAGAASPTEPQPQPTGSAS